MAPNITPTQNETTTSLNSEVVLRTLSQSSLHTYNTYSYPTRSYLFVLQGELTIKSNNTEFTLFPNNFADIFGISSIEFVSSSTNFMGYQLIIELKYFRNIIKQKPPFPLPYVMRCRTNPVLNLSGDHIRLLLRNMSRINDTLLNKKHLFHLDILEKEISIFVFELANIVCQNENYKQEESSFNRKNQLLMQFLELLSKNVKHERSVSYYSSQLCISNQYLARIVKEETGQTVYDCISYLLLNEAEALLRRKEQTVQQVAESLNFSDQASFSKFFKKHKGISPIKFKNGEGK